jgi:hypothetical protein
LPLTQKVIPDIIRGHKVPEIQETFITSITDILKSEETVPEVAKPKHSGLDIAQKTEITFTESEAPLTLNVTPERKISEINFVEEASIEIVVTNTQEKEGFLPEKEKPLTSEATIDYDIQKVASTLEVFSNISLGDLSKESTIDILPKSALLPYKSTQIEETLIHESEVPFPDIILPNKKADVSFKIDESLTITTIDASEKENDLKTSEQIDTKYASTSIPAHSVAQTSEIIPNNNFDYFEQKEISTASGKADHILLHSIVTLEVSPADTETSLHNYITPDEKQLDIIFEEEKSLQITETIVSDKEEKYVEKQNIDLQKAELSFDSHKIAELTEIITDIVPGNLITDLPEMISAKEQHTLFETAVQEETIPSDKEKIFTDKPIISNKAHMEIEESIGIPSITEIIPEDKEENLKGFEKPKIALAQVDFNGQKVAEKLEVITDVSSQILKTQKPSFVSASQNPITLESLITEEIQIHENEGILKEDKKPRTDNVHTEVVTQSGLIISSITFEDQETELNVKPIPDVKIANKLFSSEYLLPETTEHEVNQSLFEFNKEEQIMAQNASSEIIPTQSSVQTMIIESQLDISETETSKLDILRNAEVKQDVQEGLIITENITDETEKILHEIENPIQQTAKVDIKNLQSLEISEITTQDKEDTFFPRKLDQYSGITNFVEHIPLAISEIISNEVETVLPKTEKSIHQIAENKLLLPGHEIAITTEIQTTLQTDILENDKFPQQQIIPTTSDKLSALLVSETVVNESESNLCYSDKTDKKIAQLNLTSQEVAQTTEVIAMSSVNKLIDSNIPREETGIQNIEEMLSLKVSQAVINEKEYDFTSLNIPMQQTAQFTLLGREVAEVSEIIPMTATDKILKQDVLPETTSKLKLDTLQPLQISEIISGEIEQPLPNSCTPAVKTAKTHVSSQQIAETSEVTTNVSVDKLLDSEVPTNYIENISIDTLTSAIITQTNSNDLEGIVSVSSIPDLTAVDTQYVNSNSIQTLEIIATNNLEEMQQNLMPEERKGMEALETLLPLTVSQIISNESENVLTASTIPKGKIASPNLDGREIVESYETITLTNAVDFEKPVLTGESKGAEHIEGLSLAVITQPTLNESEINMVDLVQPSKKEALTNITGHEVAEIIETVPLNYFKKIQSDLVEEQKPIPQIDALSTVTTSEIIYNELEKDLLEEKIPISSIAHSQFSGNEATEITEIITVSNTDKLKQYNSPSLQEASLDVEEIMPLSISETISNELESILLINEIPVTNKATEIFKRQEIFETTEVVASATVEELSQTVTPEKQNTTEKLDVYSPLIISEIQVNEESKAVEYNNIPEKTNADINIISRDVVEYSEVVPVINVEDYNTPEMLEQQHGTTTLDLLNPLYISETISTDSENNLLLKELQNEKIAKPNIVSKEMPEILEVVALNSVEYLKDINLPEKQQSTLQFDTHSAVNIDTIIFNEKEHYLQNEVPKEELANIKLFGYETTQVMEVIPSSTTDNLTVTKLSESQETATNIQELSSITVSEILLNEKEEILPTFKSLNEIVAEANFEGQNVAQTTEITTESNITLLSEKIVSEEQRATEKINLFQPLIQTEAEINEKEIALKNADIPSKKIASVSLRSDEIAQITEVVPISNVELIKSKTTNQPEAEQIKGKPVHTSLETTSVIEITCAEKEKPIDSEEITKQYHADIVFNEQPVPQILETVPSISTKIIETKELPKTSKIQSDQVPFEYIQTDQIVIQESENPFTVERRSSIAHAQIKYKTTEGFEVSEIFSTYDKPTEMKTNIDKEVTAEIEVTKTHVAIKSKTLPESSITKLTLSHPTSKIAKNIKDIQHSITVLQPTTGETETNISEHPLPFPKKAELTLETDRLKRVGKYIKRNIYICIHT